MSDIYERLNLNEIGLGDALKAELTRLGIYKEPVVVTEKAETVNGKESVEENKKEE